MPLDRVVEVVQDNKVIVGGEVSAEEAVVSPGFAFSFDKAVKARMVLNRSMKYFTGNARYEVRSPERALQVASAEIDRSGAGPLVVFDSSRNRWVLLLPIDSVAPGSRVYHLRMPDVSFEVQARGGLPEPYPPLAGTESLTSDWKATLAWDALWYNSHLTGLPPSDYAKRHRYSFHSYTGSGNPWQVPFGDDFDGGEFVVTAEVGVPKRSGGGFYDVKAVDSWKMYGRAQRQTTPEEVFAQAQRWLRGHTRIEDKGSQNEPKKYDPKLTVLTRVIGEVACRETEWKQYNDNFNSSGLNLFPWVTKDGGYGLFQLTKPPPQDSAVWDWLRNLDDAMHRLSDDDDPNARKYKQARDYLVDGTWADGAHWTAGQLLKEVLNYYNGFRCHYWVKKRNAKGEIIGLERNPAVRCPNPGSNMDTNGNHNGVCYADMVVAGCDTAP